MGVTAVAEELQDIQRQVENHFRNTVDAQVEHKVFEELEDTYLMWSCSLGLTGSKPFGQLMGLPSGARRRSFDFINARMY